MTDKSTSSHSPGYDFFGSTPPSPAPVPVPVAQPTPGPEPVNRFGSPVPAAQAYGAPPTTAQPSYANGGQAGMATWTKVLIAVVCGAVALVLVGIVAAVVIPVFLNQRAKASAGATTLALPASIGSRSHLTDPASAKAAAQVAAVLPRGTTVGVYGAAGDPSLIVYVYPTFLPTGADAAFVAGVAQSAQSEGAPMHQVDPGALGGQGRCGQFGTGGTHCVFADHAGAVGVMVRGTGAAAERDAVAIREQVEQRAS